MSVRVGTLEVTTANVSLHGMQLVCPVSPYNRIKADIQRGLLIARIELRQAEPFDAELAIRYVSPHRDEMLIGVRMAVTDDAAREQWSAYIAALYKEPRLAPDKTSGSGRPLGNLWDKLKAKVDKPKA